LRLYEAMFVVESAAADRDWDGVCEEITTLIGRQQGRVVDLRKWDERRLAYEIKRARRGTYIIVHLEAEPASIQQMRRDFNLSEKILRHLMVLDEDGVPTGDERPGITNSITGSSGLARRRLRRPAREAAEENKEDKDKEEDESGQDDEEEASDEAEQEDDGREDAGEGDDVKDDGEDDEPERPE